MPDDEFQKLSPDEQYEYILKRHEIYWKTAVDQLIGALRENKALPGTIGLVAVIDHAPDDGRPNGSRQLAMEIFETQQGRASEALMMASAAHEFVERLGIEEHAALGIATRAAYAPLAVFPAPQDVETIKAAGGNHHVKH